MPSAEIEAGLQVVGKRLASRFGASVQLELDARDKTGSRVALSMSLEFI